MATNRLSQCMLRRTLNELIVVAENCGAFVREDLDGLPPPPLTRLARDRARTTRPVHLPGLGQSEAPTTSAPDLSDHRRSRAATTHTPTESCTAALQIDDGLEDSSIDVRLLDFVLAPVILKVR